MLSRNMRAPLRFTAWLVFWLVAALLPAHAESKVALVISNQGYKLASARLGYAHQNGDVVKAALEQSGYQVTVVRDATSAAIRSALADHAQRLRSVGPDARGIVYFAGQVAADAAAGDVILLSTDLAASRSEQLRESGIGLKSVVETLAGSAARQIVVMDGCRGLLAAPRGSSSDRSGCIDPAKVPGFTFILVRKPLSASIIDRLAVRRLETLVARTLAEAIKSGDPKTWPGSLAARVASESRGGQTVTFLDGGDQARPGAIASATAGAAAPKVATEAKRAPAQSTPAQSGSAPAVAGAGETATRGAVTAAADWDVVPVYYGTNRRPETNPQRAVYTADRGSTLELGRALVTVPKSHKVPNVERPWVYKVPFTQIVIWGEPEDPAKHFTLKEVRTLTEADWLRLIADRLGKSRLYDKHALIFIHGFNTTFDHALYRTAQIAYDLKFDGAPFVFSWPSKGELSQVAYNYDRESAEAARTHLKSFIELIATRTGAQRVSIIAHSMGHQVLMPVLDDIKREKPKGVSISEVILAAPDMERSQFASLTRELQGLGRGMTLYASANDVALKAAERYWGAGRAGGVPSNGPVVVPGLDTIDVSNTSTAWFGLNHSTYAERTELIEDIGKLLRSNTREPPPKRVPTLLEATVGSAVYWKYPPRPAGTTSEPGEVKPQ